MTALLIDEYVALGAPAGPRVQTQHHRAPEGGARVWQPRPFTPRPVVATLVEPGPVAPQALTRHAPVPTAVAPASIVAPAAGGVRQVALPERLVWTPRGLAVVLGLLGVVFGLMLVTLVVGFLSISNEPLVPDAPSPAAVLMAAPGASAGG